MRRCITEHLLLSSNTYLLHLSLSNNKITLNCSLLIHKIDLLALACVNYNYNYSHSQIVCIRKTHSLFNKLFTITTDFHSTIITPSTTQLRALGIPVRLRGWCRRSFPIIDIYTRTTTTTTTRRRMHVLVVRHWSGWQRFVTQSATGVSRVNRF